MIDQDLLLALKEMAAREETTLQGLVNALLKQALAMRRSTPTPYRLELKGWEAEEQPGVDLLDRDKLFDLMAGR